MSTKPQRIYAEDLEKLKLAAASSGKDEKDIIHELLKGAPENYFEELKQIAEARSPRRKHTGVLEVQPGRPSTEIGERLKSVIADAVETKVYLKTLGINLGDEAPPWLQRVLPQIPTGQQQMYPSYPPPQPKDIKEYILELKALDSLEKRESDPNVVAVVKDMKESIVKAIEAQRPRKEDSFNERLERIALLRTLGQDKAADQALTALKADMEKKVDALSTKVEDQKEQMHKMEMEGLESRLSKKIEDLENRPDLLQQARGIFDLARDDPLMKDVIKAVAKKQLGIEESKFSFATLGQDLEKLPIGKVKDVIVDIINAVRGARAAPAGPPPPPRGDVILVGPEEARIAQKSGIAGQLPRITESGKGVTFAEGAQSTALPPPAPMPPEASSLPEEGPEEAPSPPEKPPEKKGAKGTKTK